ncbi:hypothetical protein D3C73_1427640 [compost metagenome]
MSVVALLTVKCPRLSKKALALAFICSASQTPPATPQPINWLPSRMLRGFGVRLPQPKRAAPWS